MPLADTLIAQQKRKQAQPQPRGFADWRAGLGTAGAGRALTPATPVVLRKPTVGEYMRSAAPTAVRLGAPKKPDWLEQFGAQAGRGAEANRIVQQEAPMGALQTAYGAAKILAQPMTGLYATSMGAPMGALETAAVQPITREEALQQEAERAYDLEHPGPTPMQPFTPAGASSLAQGFYIDPLTGERRDIDPEVAAAMQALGGEPLPGGETGGLLPDAWDRQRQNWQQTMNAIMGITPGTMPDTYFGRLNREWEQYNAPLQEDQGQDWYSGDSGGWWGGGGGGGGEYNPQFWLNRVKWNI